MTPTAQRALDELLALPMVRGYASYKGSRGKCFEASLTAAIWFRRHSVPVRIVRFTRPKVVTPFSRDELLADDDWRRFHRVELASGIEIELNGSELYHLDHHIEQHAFEIEGTLLVDLTWRGWEPSSAFPRLSSVAEYAIDFDVDETMCGHCGARPGIEDCSHVSWLVETVFAHELSRSAVLA